VDEDDVGRAYVGVAQQARALGRCLLDAASQEAEQTEDDQRRDRTVLFT
jgi:hypothetical protein